MTRNPWNELYRSCRLCPRDCGVDRLEGETGFCGETAEIRLAWAGLHRGEEPPVSGTGGSGTLFFSGCTLGCVFCQNRQLSRGLAGRTVSPEELTEIFLELERQGAENLNLVTGTHFLPGILQALEEGRRRGLALPVVWNSSGYEKPESLALLAPEVALWLPDLKTLDETLARRMFAAADYPRHAAGAIRWMQSAGASGLPLDPEDPEESGRVGMIVRHLVLPGELSSTGKVLEWYRDFALPGTVLSVMTQYTPVAGADPGAPDRFLRDQEAESVYEMLEELDIQEGFFQGLPGESSGGEPGDWEPDFSRREPFPGDFARGIWFWKDSREENP